MERQNHIGALLIVLLGLPAVLSASYKNKIYQAYIGNRMEIWKSTIDEMQNSGNKTAGFLQELVNYQYGYIGYCLGNEKHTEAEKYLELAKENLKLLEKAGADPSLVSAYTSAFYGFSIGLNRMKAPFLGPKSVKFAQLAMQQNPENPLGYIQYGNSQFYMPPVFGGSKTEAVEHFKKAEKLMQKTAPENDWNYLSLLALIGQSYVEMEDYENAKIYYEKALATEPGFLWVTQDLMPALQKKMKSGN